MTIDEAINTAGREWRRLGVPARERRALTADLRLDLAAAVADGVPAEQVIEGDVATFARRLADEAAVPQSPPRYGQVTLVALAGALIGVLAGTLMVVGLYAIMVRLFNFPRGFHPPVALSAGLFYGGIGLVALAGAVIGVSILRGHLPAIGRTALTIAGLTPLAALVLVPAIMLFARSTGYSTAPAAVLTEAALAVAGFAAVTILARRWSLTPRPKS